MNHPKQDEEKPDFEFQAFIHFIRGQKFSFSFKSGTIKIDQMLRIYSADKLYLCFKINHTDSLCLQPRILNRFFF